MVGRAIRAQNNIGSRRVVLERLGATAAVPGVVVASQNDRCHEAVRSAVGTCWIACIDAAEVVCASADGVADCVVVPTVVVGRSSQGHSDERPGGVIAEALRASSWISGLVHAATSDSGRVEVGAAEGR